MTEFKIPYFRDEEGAQRFIWLQKNLKPMSKTLRDDVEERILKMEAEFKELKEDSDVQEHVKLRRLEGKLDKRYKE